MAAMQQILAVNQQRRRARSTMVYINAYVRQHFSPLNVLSDRAVQSKYRLPCGDPTPRHACVTTHSEGNPLQFCPQPGGAAPGRAAFLRSGELPGGGGERHRPQQGIGFTECGSRDTDPSAPCLDTHQNAHHPCPCSLASPLHFFFLVWLWNSCHFFLTALQSHRPQGQEGDIFWAMVCQIRFFNACLFCPLFPQITHVNRLDNYLDTPVSCDHTHTHAHVA